VAVLFVAAMLTMVAGLLSFLREIFVATASLRIGLPEMSRAADAPKHADAPKGPGSTRVP